MTLAEIAAEIGVDESTVWRLIERVLAKLRDHAERHDIDPEVFSSTVIATISGGSRKKTDIAIEDSIHAPRAALSSTSGLSGPDAAPRAGHLLPRRFPRRTPP